MIAMIFHDKVFIQYTSVAGLPVRGLWLTGLWPTDFPIHMSTRQSSHLISLVLVSCTHVPHAPRASHASHAPHALQGQEGAPELLNGHKVATLLKRVGHCFSDLASTGGKGQRNYNKE